MNDPLDIALVRRATPAACWSAIEDSWSGHDLAILTELAARNAPPLASARHLFGAEVNDIQHELVKRAMIHARERVVWVG